MEYLRKASKTDGTWLVFAGEPSYKYGMMVTSQPPITRPARRVSTVTVPGADGIYHIDEESYEPIVKTADCEIYNRKNLETIMAWLQGAGRVIYANEPQYYYNAYISNAVSFDRVFPLINLGNSEPYRFPVVFTCQPVKHSVNELNDKLTITKSGFTVRGNGNVRAKPIITVYGSGAITLNVNGTAITLKDISEYITVNSVIMDAYKGSANANLQMEGEYPLLLGNGAVNTISYTGNVTKIEVIPNWGWI